jgi:ABC-type sugar transport system permease subunit
LADGKDRRGRIIRPILLLLGMVVLGVLVYGIGGGTILETLSRLRWWQCVIVCLPYALGTAVDTLGWRFAFARDRAPFLRLVGARLAGEALHIALELSGLARGEVKSSCQTPSPGWPAPDR